MKTLTDNDLYQASLVLGRQLAVDGFLEESRKVLRAYLPIEQIVLTVFSPASGMMTVVSWSGKEGAADSGMKFKVSPDMAGTLTGLGMPISVLSRASASPVARLLVARRLIPGDASIIVSRMIVGKDGIGLLFCTAESGTAFQKKDGVLFTELRSVLSMAIANCLQYRDAYARYRRMKEVVAYGTNSAEQLRSEIIGADMGLSRVMQEVRTAAVTDEHICVTGEQGVGRTFIATHIHALSSRQKKPFLEVNCNLIPFSQLEERLFGEDLLSACGKYDNGLLFSAAGGTIYLKGAVLLKGALLWRLFRAITEKELVWEKRKERVRWDVRFIIQSDSGSVPVAALAQELSTPVISIPPLRERKEDLGRLITSFTERACRRMNRLPLLEVGRESIDACLAYDWPGNVRELKNVIERGVMLAGGGSVDLAILLPSGREYRDDSDMDADDYNLDMVVSRHIVRVLNFTSGQVGGEGGAAALMGVNPSTLRKRMRKLKIPFGRKTCYGS